MGDIFPFTKHRDLYKVLLNNFKVWELYYWRVYLISKEFNLEFKKLVGNIGITKMMKYKLEISDVSNARRSMYLPKNGDIRIIDLLDNVRKHHDTNIWPYDKERRNIYTIAELINNYLSSAAFHIDEICKFMVNIENEGNKILGIECKSFHDYKDKMIKFVSEHIETDCNQFHFVAFPPKIDIADICFTSGEGSPNEIIIKNGEKSEVKLNHVRSMLFNIYHVSKEMIKGDLNGWGLDGNLIETPRRRVFEIRVDCFPQVSFLETMANKDLSDYSYKSEIYGYINRVSTDVSKNGIFAIAAIAYKMVIRSALSFDILMLKHQYTALPSIVDFPDLHQTDKKYLGHDVLSVSQVERLFSR